jgi:hypothetical protein
MNPVIKQNEAKYYVSTADMVSFISQNAPMDWNDCCDFVRDNGICDERTYWDKDILKNPKSYNEEQVIWITAFFKAHPFIERFMIVFYD